MFMFPGSSSVFSDFALFFSITHLYTTHIAVKHFATGCADSIRKFVAFLIITPFDPWPCCPAVASIRNAALNGTFAVIKIW